MQDSVQNRVKHFLLGVRDSHVADKKSRLIEDVDGNKMSKKERQRIAMQAPKIYVMNKDTWSPDSWIYFLDIQQLCLRALAQGQSEFNARTRWCRLLRPGKLKCVVLVVVEQLDKETAKQYLSHTLSRFDINVQLDPALTYGCSVLDELIYTPVTHTRLSRLTLLHEPDCLSTNVFGEDKCVPRSQLLLSASQMLAEGFPLPPPDGLDCPIYEGYRFSTHTFLGVSDSSPLYAIDCEMCLTVTGMLELARVSLVDEKLNVCLDMLVKPTNTIVDYLTEFSGITEQMLSSVSATLIDAQNALRDLLPPDAILCGHSLPSDLHALKIFHPYTIDTSVIYNITGTYSNKASLKKLAEYFLNMEIQSETRTGHCSTEDAVATMRLVLLKLSRGLKFGDYVAQNMNALPSMANISNNRSSICFSQSASSVGIMSRISLPVNEKHVFYRHAANGRCYESLFGIANHCGHNSSLISFDWPPPESSPESLRLVRCIRDKHVAKLARRILGDTVVPYLNVVQFLGYGARAMTCNTNINAGEIKQEDDQLLARLDKRISRILSETPKNSLFILVAAGKAQREVANQQSNDRFSGHSSSKMGLCCVKVT